MSSWVETLVCWTVGGFVQAHMLEEEIYRWVHSADPRKQSICFLPSEHWISLNHVIGSLFLYQLFTPFFSVLLVFCSLCYCNKPLIKLYSFGYTSTKTTLCPVKKRELAIWERTWTGHNPKAMRNWGDDGTTAHPRTTECPVLSHHVQIWVLAPSLSEFDLKLNFLLFFSSLHYAEQIYKNAEYKNGKQCHLNTKVSLKNFFANGLVYLQSIS